MHVVLQTNTILNGRWKILGPIASGGMGGVYRAADTRIDDREVALKYIQIPPCDPAERLKWIKMVEMEAKLLSKLQHPALPIIYDFFMDGAAYCIVMNLIPGQTLKEWLAAKTRGGKSAKIDEILALVIQICHVLEYLHTQNPPILFRDMKPANVILRPDGTVCLIDFGIAGFLRPKQAPNPQDGTMNIGSHGYAAPEQWSELAQSDVTTDVYGVCAMLHELLTGADPATRAPFMFPKPSKLRQGVKAELEQIIMRGLEMDQAERWPTVNALRQALEKYLGHPGNRPQAVAPLTGQLVTSTTFQSDPELLTIFTQIKMPAGGGYGQEQLTDQRWNNKQAYERLRQYCQAGLLEEAFREAERLVKAMRQLARYNDEKNLQDEFLFILGKLEEARGNLERAKKAYQESILCDPTRQLAYQALARIKQAPLIAQAQQQVARAQAAQKAAQTRQAAVGRVRSAGTKFWQIICQQFSLADAADRLSTAYSFLLPTAITIGGQIGFRTDPQFLASLDGLAWAGLAGMVLIGWFALHGFFGAMGYLYQKNSINFGSWMSEIVVASLLFSAAWLGNGILLDDFWPNGDLGERGQIFNTLAEVEPKESIEVYRGRLRVAASIATYDEYLKYLVARRALDEAITAYNNDTNKVSRFNRDAAQADCVAAIQALKEATAVPPIPPVPSPEDVSHTGRDHGAGWLLLF